MIEIKQTNDVELIKKYAEIEGVEYSDNLKMIKAFSGDEILGFSLFNVFNKKMVIETIKPKEDILFLDGILRSTLHFASENLIEEVYYGEKAPESEFIKHNFVEDLSNKKLKMLGLLGNCENCLNCK